VEEGAEADALTEVVVVRLNRHRRFLILAILLHQPFSIVVEGLSPSALMTCFRDHRNKRNRVFLSKLIEITENSLNIYLCFAIGRHAPVPDYGILACVIGSES
jgi:hypothetical protein